MIADKITGYGSKDGAIHAFLLTPVCAGSNEREHDNDDAECDEDSLALNSRAEIKSKIVAFGHGDRRAKFGFSLKFTFMV